MHDISLSSPFSIQSNGFFQGRRANAGSDFFGMPATQLSPEFQADMRLLKVRGVLDPQRHYKKDSSKSLMPNFSEVGTIIQGPTEHFSRYLPRSQRKPTLVSEVLSTESSTNRFRNKYDQIQASKSSGKKAYYKNLRAKRGGGIRKS